jgi:DNA-binding HxlR family transcriptional regulator
MPGESEATSEQIRAGGRILLTLSDTLNASIVRLLAARQLSATGLAKRLGGASRATRFRRLRELEELGVIVRERIRGAPPSTRYRLSAAGQLLLLVTQRLDDWLELAPGGSLALGVSTATIAIRALAGAWGSTILRELAERPRSLTELDSLIPAIGHIELERTLRTLADVELVERIPGEERRHPYRVTPWARESVAPLAEAARWERRHLAERSAPVTALDAEAGLLLALPLVELPVEAEGTCVLLADFGPPGERLAGVAVQAAAGRVVASQPLSDPVRGSWARGSVLDWLDAVIEGKPDELRVRGDVRLVQELIYALHVALFRRVRPPQVAPAGTS